MPAARLILLKAALLINIIIIVVVVGTYCMRTDKAGGGHFEHCFFGFDIVFTAITATLLAVVDQ